MDDQLTEEQIAEFKEVFSIFDRDGNSTIATDHLEKVLKCLGIKLRDAELQEISDEVDVKGIGIVEFSDFLSMMARKMAKAKSENENEMLAVFKFFDKDNIGYIAVEELNDVMLSLGQKLTKEELYEMINEADADGDGLVSYKDFVKMMTRVDQDDVGSTHSADNPGTETDERGVVRDDK